MRDRHRAIRNAEGVAWRFLLFAKIERGVRKPLAARNRATSVPENRRPRRGARNRQILRSLGGRAAAPEFASAERDDGRVKLPIPPNAYSCPADTLPRDSGAGTALSGGRPGPEPSAQGAKELVGQPISLVGQRHGPFHILFRERLLGLHEKALDGLEVLLLVIGQLLLI